MQLAEANKKLLASFPRTFILILKHSFQFPLPNGLHARPASHLQNAARRFDATITLINGRNGRQADAKSVISLISADVKNEDPCTFVFSGSAPSFALDEFKAYLDGAFLDCDVPLPKVESLFRDLFIPRSLRKAGLGNYIVGATLCSGIGWGKVVVANGRKISVSSLHKEVGSLEKERSDIDRAIRAVGDSMSGEVVRGGESVEAQVLHAHLAILRDPAFREKIDEILKGKNVTAGEAILAACDSFSETLRKAENAYLHARVLDMEDVCTKLLRFLYGTEFAEDKLLLTEPSICIAGKLTPAQLLSLNRTFLKALVISEITAGSHTAILARSFNIPTVMCADRALIALREGQTGIVDANLGIVIPEVTEGVGHYYRHEQKVMARLLEKGSAAKLLEAKTIDGRIVTVSANIASDVEAVVAFDSGAEGIGLFRTEMLFMGGTAAPSEEAQAAVYTRTVKAAGGRHVTIRTLDIGGDKPVPYLGLPPESNPFLGYRGVRIYVEYSDVIKTQLRAILRAAEHGPVRIMVPMVSCPEEVILFKRLLAEARDGLRAENPTAAEAEVELGIMLEVPSVAFQMPQFCREVSFFSIGTNDLKQYFMAAGRDNMKVAPLYSTMHPPFLRLLRSLVDAAHAEGKPIGLCGEIAEQGKLLPFLVGLGIDEISVPSSRVAESKAMIRRLDFVRCSKLAEKILGAETQDEVLAGLEELGYVETDQAVLVSDLILLESEAATKEEAIKEMVDALHIVGRTKHPVELEEEIWLREDAYSTGFGQGLAIPHCKSKHLTASSVVVLRTKNGGNDIQWGSLDNIPVKLVVMLAMQDRPALAGSVNTLSFLSRLIMQDDFCARLFSETDPNILAMYILERLESKAAASSGMASQANGEEGGRGTVDTRIEEKEVISQDSWVVRSDQVEVSITRHGAQMAPVTFFRSDAEPVQPYYISPWQGEEVGLSVDGVLTPLRGDFFCLPFGGNDTLYHGEKHPPHGETAGVPWSLVGVQRAPGVTSVNLSVDTTVRKGRIDAQFSLVDGENVVYRRTCIHGFVGKTSFAHHAILSVPDEVGALSISASPFQFGMTCPYVFSNPQNGEYQSLAIGAEFSDLAHVPVIFGDQQDTDCSRFPARRGFADLLQTYDQVDGKQNPAWIAVVNTHSRFLWYALKDPARMPGRVLWMENHGRHGNPWNGRNRCLGVEDGCSFFDKGLAESVAPNIINERGIPTCVELKAESPYVINYIQGVVKVPVGFSRVEKVEFGPGGAVFVSSSGECVSAKVQYDFVFGASLSGACL
ncbi:MAG: phosphoenolpyruvate--protein phosphotransferase [Chthoniobacteraceae bacterium]